jgi:hypothetical protein
MVSECNHSFESEKLVSIEKPREKHVMDLANIRRPQVADMTVSGHKTKAGPISWTELRHNVVIFKRLSHIVITAIVCPVLKNDLVVM